MPTDTALPLRLVCLTLVSVAVLCTVLIAIYLIGGLFPNPVALLFTNPDGSACQMPCLFGVRPGEMSVTESIRILNRHVLSQPMSISYGNNKVIFVSKVAYLSLTFDRDKVVNSVTLYHNSVGAIPDPELETEMQSVVPGNLIQFFGVRGEIDSMWDISPTSSSIIQRCYVEDTTCFANVRWAVIRPWHTELSSWEEQQFLAVTVSQIPSNSDRLGFTVEQCYGKFPPPLKNNDQGCQALDQKPSLP